MPLLATPSTSAAARALYRSLLRTACRMPDDHRRAFVVHRTRSEFDKSRTLTRPEEIAARVLEAEVYRDQLEFQAEHLTALARQQNLLIPVDLRSPSSPSSSPVPTSSLPATSPTPNSPTRQGPARRVGPSRPQRPSRPFEPHLTAAPGSTDPSSLSSPFPSPRSLDRRKLIRAIQARKKNIRSGAGLRGRNRFMEGPEPSWIRKKKEQVGAAGETGGHVHGEGCECH